ncbi:hypothetical protein IW140_001454 [Coemansia sp. RSA 1813]|nr:hypothetical protein EV178_003304 [Coemansia sp. RSA 1646]KAJ1771529.1 hypothetical protein LPJ74_002217 [Coemansia sp. RSA 1843]KAJ2089612.1 hypothetical protein IW138_003354 [Coemansia sp. RSA 986]KAJ2214714.1 hypothetical protein EV179_002819 [Coemansia sp. RSA 487]KAJ2571536.1 hypothetical protein IW140_001454 [Coemansia sp. RSA 1813]
MASRVAASSARSLGRLNASSTAFLLCDIQEKFRPGIHAFECLVQVAQKMSKASRILKIPLIVTEQYSKGLGHTVEEIDIAHASLVDDKSRFSMFTPSVAKKLEELQIRSVVLYGIESHVCVLQTCLELMDNNYDVHVLADGVSSMNYPEIDVALRRMADGGAHVVSSESVLFQITNDSKHPDFKAISSLVKEFQPAARQNKLLFRQAPTTAQL